MRIKEKTKQKHKRYQWLHTIDSRQVTKQAKATTLGGKEQISEFLDYLTKQNKNKICKKMGKCDPYFGVGWGEQSI